MKNPPDNSNELFIALVAAVGINLDLLVDQIRTQLSSFDYRSHSLHLSDYLAEQASSDFRGLPFDEKVWEAMTAGDELRQRWGRSDALALQAISDIVATREQASSDSSESSRDGDEEPPNLDRHAFVIRSLKTPDELETLRSVYGPRLIVIAAYSPRTIRLQSLADQIQDSRNSSDQETWVHQPEELIARDEKEQKTGGQDVSGTFHRADFFIRAWSRDVMEADLKRAFAILFGDPFRTPTTDEYCQFLAAGAALRSAEFGRQVGATIASEQGSILALGTNEVPKPEGGSHWDGDEDGNREFEVSEVDTNRKHFNELAERLTSAVDQNLEIALAEHGGDIPTESSVTVRQVVGAALPDVLRQAGLKDLTEFGRAVHAEMNALLDAARRGIAVQDATLYTTTFPCHNCARHIIGAGIKRVVFIEPYGKSRAPQLHKDAVSIEGSDSDENDKVQFVPFVGVAPRRYLEMFDAATRERLGHRGRQDSDGKRQELDKKTAVPVFADSGLWQFRPELREYRAKELLALEHFNEHAEEE